MQFAISAAHERKLEEANGRIYMRENYDVFRIRKRHREPGEMGWELVPVIRGVEIPRKNAVIYSSSQMINQMGFMGWEDKGRSTVALRHGTRLENVVEAVSEKSQLEITEEHVRNLEKDGMIRKGSRVWEAEDGAIMVEVTTIPTMSKVELNFATDEVKLNGEKYNIPELKGGLIERIKNDTSNI